MLVGSVWTMTKLFAQPLERHLNQLDRRTDRLEGRMTEGFARIREDIRALGTPPTPLNCHGAPPLDVPSHGCPAAE